MDRSVMAISAARKVLNPFLFGLVFSSYPYGVLVFILVSVPPTRLCSTMCRISEHVSSPFLCGTTNTLLFFKILYSIGQTFINANNG